MGGRAAPVCPLGPLSGDSRGGRVWGARATFKRPLGSLHDDSQGGCVCRFGLHLCPPVLLRPLLKADDRFTTATYTRGKRDTAVTAGTSKNVPGTERTPLPGEAEFHKAAWFLHAGRALSTGTHDLSPSSQ